MAADMWKGKVAQGCSRPITGNRASPDQRDQPQGRSRWRPCPRKLHRLLHVPAHVVRPHTALRLPQDALRCLTRVSIVPNILYASVLLLLQRSVRGKVTTTHVKSISSTCSQEQLDNSS